MEGAEPFLLKGGSKTAVLMIHGFEGSPYSLRELGDLIHEMGHTVIAPLLPGHGTSVMNFQKTRYEHWYYAIEKLYLKERPKFEKFFLFGFSLGGNLALKTAISFSKTMPPSGIVSVSTPIILNGFIDSQIVFTDWRLLVSGILKEFINFIPKKRSENFIEKISPWVGYRDYHTTSCLHSIKINFPKIKNKLHQIKAPICLIQATNDRTIDPKNLYLISNRVSSKEKKTLMFEIEERSSTRHVLTTHETSKKKVFDYILKFIDDISKIQVG